MMYYFKDQATYLLEIIIKILKNFKILIIMLVKTKNQKNIFLGKIRGFLLKTINNLLKIANKNKLSINLTIN